MLSTLIVYYSANKKKKKNYRKILGCFFLYVKYSLAERIFYKKMCIIVYSHTSVITVVDVLEKLCE